jgi:hypothetical protein
MNPELLASFALKCIRKVQENKKELQNNGLHQVGVYANGNLLGENINAIKGIEILLQSSKETCPGVNIDKTKYTRVYPQTFPDWPPGARTANGTALCH